MRCKLEQLEDQLLAPYAARSRDASRRRPIDNEGRSFDYRSQFQRDRDRIVYSRAFRRLRQKAVTGTLPAYEDHRRNRLTHTLEVSQLARTVGRALRLNEDLIEAIALGHDLGQPPFGPTGERALDDLLAGRLDGRGGPGLGDLGGFARAWQGLRVVDRIEKRYGHPGLNLTDAVREGVLKSGSHAGIPADELQGVRAGRPAGLEAQIVALADRVAVASGDLDDALHSGVVDLSAAERLRSVRELQRKLGERYPARAARFVRINAIHRGLLHLLATSAIVSTQRVLSHWCKRWSVRAHQRFLEVQEEALEGTEVRLSPGGERLLVDLEGFLAGRVRRGVDADRVEARGRRAALGLFLAYHADATLLPDHVLLRFKEQVGGSFLRDVPRQAVEAELARRYRADPVFARLLADHLASMTDAFALAEHARLLEMAAIPIPSSEQLRRET